MEKVFVCANYRHLGKTIDGHEDEMVGRAKTRLSQESRATHPNVPDAL